MVILNLLLLVVTTASARAIEGVASKRSPTMTPLLESPTGDQQKCVFSPGVPTRYPQEPSQIPPSAWPVIVSILASQIVIQEHLTSDSTLPDHQSIMRSLDLGRAVDDPRLEGVIIGWVFSAWQEGSEKGAQQALGGREGMKKGEQELECLDQAVREVGKRRQMEGVKEFERGRLSFLVYRVD